MSNTDLIDYSLGALFLTPVYTYYDDELEPYNWAVYEDEDDIYETLYRDQPLHNTLRVEHFDSGDNYIAIDTFNPY